MDFQKCTSLSDYFALISSALDWKKTPKHASALLFRGQADVDWKLEPSLQRSFRDAPDLLRNAETNMLRQLKKSAPYLFPTVLSNDWDLLSLAQHYGMNTRLLDWTTNPLVGLWFALSEKKPCDAAVWIFRPNTGFIINPRTTSENVAKITQTRVFKPTAHSPRISNQSGWHTVHKFREDDGLISLEEMRPHNESLTRVTIPRGCRSKLFKDVENSGITATSVFGDLAGFCQFVSNANQPSSLIPDPPPPRKSKVTVSKV